MRFLCFQVAFWLCLAAQLAAGEDPAQPLRHVRDILDLPEAALHGRVRAAITGVVTSAEPHWGRQIFVHDGTGGILLTYDGAAQYAVGDLVEAEGIAGSGSFTATIGFAKIRKIGTAPLPEPKPAMLAEVLTGALDGERIAVEGWVRSVGHISPALAALDLSSGRDRLALRVSSASANSFEGLEGAKIRVIGVSRGLLKRENVLALSEVRLFVANPSELTVVEPPQSVPAPEANASLRAPFTFNPKATPGTRAAVMGTVSFCNGRELYLSKAGLGLAVHATQPLDWKPGDQVVATGFPEIARKLPLLDDAVVRKADASLPPLAPTPFVQEEFRSGGLQSAYVRIEGELLDRIKQPSAGSPGSPGISPAVSVRAESGVFLAEFPPGVSVEATAGFEPGSRVEVTGVCLTGIGQDGEPLGFRIALPALENLRVLKRPPFWQPQRLLAALEAALAALAVITAGGVLLARRNTALSAEIREKNAISSERRRLARELHDSLEQALTAIDLRVEGARRSTAEDNPVFCEHIEAVGRLVQQSHAELRCAIWDLRQEAPEGFDLGASLGRAARAILSPAGVQCDIVCEGEPRPLPALYGENLFRIGQEALTNIAKHAHARKVEIKVLYRPNLLSLSIRDDGRGFDVSHAAAGNQYGLLGMQERARRIHASIHWQSAAGQGTELQAETPLPAARALHPSLTPA